MSKHIFSLICILLALIVNSFCVITVYSAGFLLILGAVGFVWLLFLNEWVSTLLVVGYFFTGLVPNAVAKILTKLFEPATIKIAAIFTALKNDHPNSDSLFWLSVGENFEYFTLLQGVLLAPVWILPIFYLLLHQTKPAAYIPLILLIQLGIIQVCRKCFIVKHSKTPDFILWESCRWGFMFGAIWIILIRHFSVLNLSILFVTVPLVLVFLSLGWYIFGFRKIWSQTMVQIWSSW